MYLNNIIKQQISDIVEIHPENITEPPVMGSIIQAKKNGRPLLLCTMDNIENYLDKIDKAIGDYDRYVIVCPANHPHPHCFASLDILQQMKERTKIPTVIHNFPKKFDFLFLPGKDQIWRLQLIKKLLDSKLLDNSLWSFYKDHDAIFPAMQKLLPEKYEIEEYRNQRFNPYLYGQIIMKIQYESTFFSLVTETGNNITFANNSICHFTEKTFKPLLAEHPFIIQSGEGHLEFLRSLGLKTFDSIIDESYENNNEKIVETCRYVLDLNQQDFYRKTDTIRKHNRQLLMEDSFVLNFHMMQLKKIKTCLKL